MVDERAAGMPSDNPERCAHYMPRKKRRCNLPRVPPAAYCTVHTPAFRKDAVPCPHCSTVLRRESVRAHVRVCPRALSELRAASHPSYSRDVNLDLSRFSASERERMPAASPTDEAEDDKDSEHDRGISIVFRPLSELPEDVSSAMRAAEELYKLHVKNEDIWRFRRSHDVPETERLRQRWGNARDSTVRLEHSHFTQSSSLFALAYYGPITKDDKNVWKTNEIDQANPQEIGIIELGAGRAYTLLFATEVLRLRDVSIHAIAIDRNRPRLGADRSIRSLSHTYPSSKDAKFTFNRIKCDLKDISLQALDSLHFTPFTNHVIILAKHACGAAMDLSLIALDNYAHAVPGRRISAALASCCRHRCAWQVTPAAHDVWIRRWHKGEDSYGHVCRMAGWCLGCTNDDDAVRTGALCQELVDAARVLWLRERGWDAHLVRYTDATTSPENVAIVAHYNPPARSPPASPGEAVDL